MQTIWSEWFVSTVRGVASLTLRGGLLALAIFAVQFAFREKLSAGWRYGLWALLLARLLIPEGPASGWSMYGWLARTAVEMTAAPSIVVDEASHERVALAVGEIAFSDAASESDAAALVELREVHTAPPAGFPVDSPTAPRVWAGLWPLAAGLWLAGVAWIVLRLAVTHLRLARAVARTRPVTDSRLLDCMEDCKAEMGLHVPVSLVVSPHVRTPALLGFVRPRLILPAASVEDLSPGDLRMVFLHELAHLKRLDIPVAWIMETVRSIHWFNPLVLLALRRMRREREMACDERVIRQIGDAARSEYGRALLRFLESAPAPVSAAGLLGIGEQTDAMAQRIRRIAEGTRRTRPLLGLALLAALALTGLTDSMTRADAESGAISESLGLENKPRAGALIADFARLKRDEARKMARHFGLDMPAEIEAYFAAADAGRWGEASAIFADLAYRSGQYEYGKEDKAIRTPMWQCVLETDLAYSACVGWDEAILFEYADDILGIMPPGAVYFGGTDPGRGILTAFQSVRGKPDIVVLTQNALADNAYMDALRFRYGDRLALPDTNEVNRCFKDVADQYAKAFPDGKEVEVVEGRVSIKSVQWVMQVNALLSKGIFEKNKQDHPFFVEESYLIEWMSPHQIPVGLILALQSDAMPGPLSETVVRENDELWNRWERRLLEDPAFIGNRTMRRTFAKLRTAIAGLYAQRRLDAQAEKAFLQALRFEPGAPESAFRFADFLSRRKRFEEAIEAMAEAERHNPSELGSRAKEYIRNIRVHMDAQEKDATGKTGAPSTERPHESFATHLRLISLIEDHGAIRVGLRDPARNKDYLLAPGETFEGIELISADLDNEEAVLRKGEETVLLSLKSGEMRPLDPEAKRSQPTYTERRQARLDQRYNKTTPEAPSDLPPPTDNLLAIRFKDVPVEQVIRTYCDLLDLVPVQAPGVSAVVSLRSTNRLTEEQVRRAIETLLDLHGIHLQRKGANLLITPGPARAWPETPPPPAPAHTPGAEPKLYSLSFRNAPLDQVLNLYAEITGLTIVRAPGIAATLTLQTGGKRLDYDQAVTAILDLLGLHDIQIAHEDFMAVVTPLTR